jgi:predicted DNA-binding protein
MEGNMETLSFQASGQMKARLEFFANEFDRSKGYLIRQALEAYFEEVDDYLEAKAYKAIYNPKENIKLDDIKRKYKFDN